MPPEQASQVESVDQGMAGWRQGDVVPASAFPFLHWADADRPLTVGARDVVADGTVGDDRLIYVATESDGFVILSQDCDLVRSCAERPLVQVAALESVNGTILTEVQRGFRPQLAYVPAVAAQGLVANLDRVMTVEKALLASVPVDDRVSGCTSPKERTDFAAATARKYARYAFPDDFVEAFRPVQKRMRDKHNKHTDEGAVLRAMREIRVVCYPVWDAGEVELTVLFIFDTLGSIPPKAATVLQNLMEHFTSVAQYRESMHRIVSMDTLSAAQYFEAQPLDLDALSTSSGSLAQ